VRPTFFPIFQKAAAPGSGAECARLWRRGPSYDEREHTSPTSRASATADPGDGYEVLDVDCLAAAPPLRPPRPPRNGAWGGQTPRSSRSVSSHSSTRSSRRDPVTVGRWLGLSPSPRDGGSAAVDLIVETRPSPSAAWSRAPLQLDSRIRVGDCVDAMDSARKWYEAVVREVGEDTVKVHFVGWGGKWDTTLPRRRREGSAVPPPAPLWTRTSKWRERIAVGDEVEIRESTSVVMRPKWHRAVVLAVGFEGEVPREIEGGAPLELYDEDGGEGKAGRKRPLLLMGRTRQVSFCHRHGMTFGCMFEPGHLLD